MATTDLRLYAGVPLTTDNINFIDDFTNDTEKLSLFETYKVKQYTVSPIRRSFESIVVDDPIDEVDTVNYMTFKNADGHRYFCYVTRVVYESEGGSRIYFQIDPMTTWKNQIVLKDSHIEREHVIDDTLFTNIVEENLEIGEVITRSFEQTTDINDLVYVVASTKQFDELPSPPTPIIDAVGDEYANVYSGLAYIGFDNVLDLNLYLFDAEVAGYEGSTQSIFVMPRNLIDTFVNNENIHSDSPVILNYIKSKNFTDIDGYFPKNNKLYNYPYNFLYVSSQGQNSVYKYEYSTDTQMIFEITSNLQANPTVYLTPKNYKGVVTNYDETMTLSNYPLCAWVDDSYRNWLAQNVVSNPLSVLTSTLSLGVGIATANPIAIAGGVIGVASTIGNFKEKSIVANRASGSQTGGGNVALGAQTFNVYSKTITAQYAEIIDGYFSMYGYKVNRLDTPNLNTRPKFNYIKTIDCNVQGAIPSQDLQSIRDIFNNGVTFWHSTDVGNYNVINTP